MNRPFFRWQPWLAAVAAFGAVLALAFWYDGVERAAARHQAREGVVQQLSMARARLEGALNSRLYLVRGLSAYVANHPDITQNGFSAFARELLRQQSGVRSLQLAHDGVVSHVYPLEGNRQAMGLQLLATPGQQGAAQRALASRSTVVAGPVDLVQGGTAFVSRTPIYLGVESGQPRFWGFASILLDEDSLFREAALADGIPGLRVALRGMDATGAAGQPFWGDATVFQNDPVVQDVLLPNGSWQIAAVPDEGWAMPGSLGRQAGGVALALLAGMLSWRLARSPTRLRDRVQSVSRALRASEQDFRGLVQGADSLVVKFDTGGHILFMNDYALRFFGYEKEEVLGRHALETLVPPVSSTGEDLRTFVAEAFRHPEAHGRRENENRRKDGSRVWVSWNNTPLRDETGNLVGMLSVGTDLTERRRMEEALRESEANFRSLLESARVFVVYRMAIDPTALPHGIRVDLVSPSVREFLGIEGTHDFIQWFTSMPPEDQAAVMEANRRCIERGDTFDMTIRWRHLRRGDWMWIHVISNPVRDESGRVTHFNGLMVDVTRQKEAETFLQQANEALEARVRERTAELLQLNESLRRENEARILARRALEESESKLRKAAKLGQLGYFDNYPDRDESLWSEELERIFGVERPGGVHPFADFFNAIHPDDREHVLSLLAGDAWEEVKGEFRIIRPDGTVRHIFSYAYRERDEAGRVTHIFGVDQDITELKQAEAALAERNALYHTLLQAQSDMGQGMAIIEAGRMVFVNDAMSVLTGYARDEILALPSFAELVHPFDRAFVLNNYRRRMDGEERATRYETGLLTKDGERREVEVSVATLPVGSTLRVVALLVDITRRKRMEAELREAHDELERRVWERTHQLAEINASLSAEVSERRRVEQALIESDAQTRALLNALPDMMFLMTREGVFLSFHAPDPATLVVPPEAIVGRSIRETMPPHIAEEALRCGELALAAGLASMEYNVMLQGRLQHFEARMVPCGESRVLAIVRDITARKEGEDTLRRQAQIINQIHEAVITTDFNGIVTFWNQGAERMYGYTADETVGCPISEFYEDPGHYTILPEVLEYLHRYGVYESESRRRKKSGEILHVHLILSFLRNGPGEPIGLIGYSVDITERKRLEREIIDVSEEEQKRIGQELHDGLGQHLTGVAFLGKVLEGRLANQSLAEAKDAGEIVNLINQAVSKTRALARGLFPVELESNGLMAALEQLAATGRHLYQMECRFVAAEAVLVEDALSAINLYRIAQEALNNAAKHGKAHEVVIELGQNDGRISLVVSDDGVGFDPAEHGPGRGMGLHIMRYRAELIGLRVDIRPRPGGGTVVHVS